ncbi:hypothetical protein RhiJN_18844 [Ceratobasidium sp. AG-Ba]|nr:hypothetical protein RhiJN_18844 [Ceratobasidium sp. AG-Ba]
MSEVVHTANESTDTERLGSISQVLGHRHVLVACGDSFVGPLTLLDRRRVYVKKFSGASAKGLSNKNSLSQAGVLVTKLLDKEKPEQLLLVFGQVDLHILYLWKALKAQLDDSNPPSPNSWGDAVLKSYITFIQDDILPRRELRSGYLRNIFVASIIMPCVRDEHLDECVRKYRRREEEAAQTRDLRLIDCKVPTDIQTRRAMVQQVNSGLSAFCNENQVRFVDINRHITTETGEVLPHVVDHDPTTIHVQWESTIGYWVEELADTGLTESDISVDIDASALQYEAEKKDRMRRRKLAPPDATLSPTLSDFSIPDEPGSPILRPTTWQARGRPSTPPGTLMRSAQTSPENGPSWHPQRSALGRIRGTSSPPRGSRSTGFRRSVTRRNSVPTVTLGLGRDDVFQSQYSSPVHTPPQTPLLGEFSPENQAAAQDEESTQTLEPSEQAK